MLLNFFRRPLLMSWSTHTYLNNSHFHSSIIDKKCSKFNNSCYFGRKETKSHVIFVRKRVKWHECKYMIKGWSLTKSNKSITSVYQSNEDLLSLKGAPVSEITNWPAAPHSILWLNPRNWHIILIPKIALTTLFSITKTTPHIK